MLFPFLVSNPIREYLQISYLHFIESIETGFKPYKGVSSNGIKNFLYDSIGMFQTL